MALAKLSQSQAQGWGRHWLGLKVATKLRHFSETNFINLYWSLLSLISVWETKHQFKVVTLWILKAKVGGFNKAKMRVAVISECCENYRNISLTPLLRESWVIDWDLAPLDKSIARVITDHHLCDHYQRGAHCTILKHTIWYYLSSYDSSSSSS